eukprot:5637402-Pyramimonas_sp.AAC.1
MLLARRVLLGRISLVLKPFVPSTRCAALVACARAARAAGSWRRLVRDLGQASTFFAQPCARRGGSLSERCFLCPAVHV